MATNGAGGFVQSEFSSPGADDLHNLDNTYDLDGTASTESERDRKRQETNNLASRKSRVFKREWNAAMEHEIELFQAENAHLRGVVREMDPVLSEVKAMVREASQV